MEDKKKEGRYLRVYNQLEELLQKTEDPIARMASICAVLHHKMNHYFWTGFYLLKGDQLIVGPYQGPVACQDLERDKGVCWAGKIRAIFDVDSDSHNSFSNVDKTNLEKIISLIFAKIPSGHEYN